MFVVVIHYTKPDEIETHRAAHLAWIKRYSEDGTFLLCGPQPTHRGGIVVVNAPSRERLDEILEGDGYTIGGVARHEVIEFTARSGSLLPAIPA